MTCGKRMRVLLALFLAIFQLGCKSGPVSSVKVQSPDGAFTATAEGFDNGGISPGLNIVKVYLQERGTEDRMVMLILVGGSPSSMQPRM